MVVAHKELKVELEADNYNIIACAVMKGADDLMTSREWE